MAAAVPVSVKGIGGPGAPHEFLLERRINTGSRRGAFCFEFGPKVPFWKCIVFQD